MWSQYSVMCTFRVISRPELRNDCDKTPLCVDSICERNASYGAARARTYVADSTKSYKKTSLQPRRPASGEKSSTSMKANDPASLLKKICISNSTIHVGDVGSYKLTSSLPFFFFFTIFSTSFARNTHTLNKNSTFECQFYVAVILWQGFYISCLFASFFFLD